MKTTINLTNTRQLLEEKRQRLLERLDEHQRQATTANPDRSDLAWRYTQKQNDLLLEAGDKQQLAEIEAALQRIEDGSYGFCSQCGQPIQPGRLEIMPTATLCMQCKTNA